MSNVVGRLTIGVVAVTGEWELGKRLVVFITRNFRT